MALLHHGRNLLERITMKACRRGMAHTYGMHRSGRERVNLPDSLGNEGAHDNEDLPNAVKYDAAPVGDVVTNLPMHSGCMRNPGDIACMHVVATAGRGPTLWPWTRVEVAMTSMAPVVMVSVVVIREVPWAPPLPPTHFVHLLRRGANHLIHLALTAHVPVEAAMLARTGVTSAANRDLGRAIRWLATGSFPGKGHPRGCIYLTSSMAEGCMRDQWPRAASASTPAGVIPPTLS